MDERLEHSKSRVNDYEVKSECLVLVDVWDESVSICSRGEWFVDTFYSLKKF